MKFFLWACTKRQTCELALPGWHPGLPIPPSGPKDQQCRHFAQTQLPPGPQGVFGSTTSSAMLLRHLQGLTLQLAALALALARRLPHAAVGSSPLSSPATLSHHLRQRLALQSLTDSLALQSQALVLTHHLPQTVFCSSLPSFPATLLRHLPQGLTLHARILWALEALVGLVVLVLVPVPVQSLHLPHAAFGSSPTASPAMLSRPLLQVLTLQWLVDPLPLLASALALVLLLVLMHHLPRPSSPATLLHLHPQVLLQSRVLRSAL
mmetsp:Transcript_33737/g.72856  ORF Transcript_33737/g.72856 Transcript_33737/m.72856 type:complete len:265 (+) Transcript_33737:338-1132(+)